MLDNGLDNTGLDEPELTAPMLDEWLRSLSLTDVTPTGDQVVVDALRRVFTAAEALEVCGGDEARIFWAELKRGTYEDFAAMYDDEDTPPDRDEWQDSYPSETGWFQVVLTRYRGAIGLTLNHHSFAVTPGDSDDLFPHWSADPWPDPRLRLVMAWLEPAVSGVVDAVRAGTYNSHAAANLPDAKRLGKIRRADWWAISPESREWHLGDFSDDEADRLYETVANRGREFWKERLPQMTVDTFLKACQIGYQATHVKGCDDLTPRELYVRHADGRHDGLLDIDPTSPDAFAEWEQSGFKGGHPWEILRGGNSTHVCLFASHDDNGWWFTVAGASAGRSVESARIFLALDGAGLPVELADGPSIATMLIGADDIGIVPEDVLPRYCHRFFPGEKITDFMNLSRESRRQVVDRAYWYPIPLVRLSVGSVTTNHGMK